MYEERETARKGWMRFFDNEISARYEQISLNEHYIQYRVAVKTWTRKFKRKTKKGKEEDK